jgi:hypothetical protein
MNKLALLAPVKESYLEQAIRDIYPQYEKVSFGSNMKRNEMNGIKAQYLTFVREQKVVYVYLFYKEYVRYRGVLIDEFRFYDEPTRHPDPWGSWNLIFQNYYTVKNIVPCEVPVTDFTNLGTKNKVSVSPHKPVRVIDHRWEPL